MNSWYSDRARNGDVVTRVKKFTLPMLGSRTDYARQPFKGAEAKGLVPLIVHLLRQHGVEGDLLPAGEHLIAASNIIDSSPIVFDEATSRSFNREIVAHVVLSLRGGARPLKKHHQALHMAHRAKFHGNPSFYANWLDESLNQDLARIANASYAKVWHERLLAHWLCRADR